MKAKIFPPEHLVFGRLGGSSGIVEMSWNLAHKLFEFNLAHFLRAPPIEESSDISAHILDRCSGKDVLNRL